MRHPSEKLDDAVHQRVRLGALALLSTVVRADFAHLKTSLGTTDGNLGRHLQVLEENGLVKITKSAERGRARTWVTITRQGRTALRIEIAALKEIVDIIEGAPGSSLSGLPAEG